MIDPNVLGAEYQAPEINYELESTRFLNLSYSLYGEDLIIRSKLKKKFFSGAKGIYIDIGAFHPFLASNTYLFYGAGWSGVCIDPNPIFSNAFAQMRPRDTFKNIAVLNEEKNLYFAEHLQNTGRRVRLAAPAVSTHGYSRNARPAARRRSRAGPGLPPGPFPPGVQTTRHRPVMARPVRRVAVWSGCVCSRRPDWRLSASA